MDTTVHIYTHTHLISIYLLLRAILQLYINVMINYIFTVTQKGCVAGVKLTNCVTKTIEGVDVTYCYCTSNLCNTGW